MKKLLKTKPESFDEIIARFQRNFDDAPDGPLKESCREYKNDLLIQKEVTNKATEEIIKAVIKRTIKEIRLFYPALLTWKEESRYFQFRITRCLFTEDVINDFGGNVQSISVTCKDGIVRIFNIKIEAFYGCMSEKNQILMNLVKVYFALRDPS